ncbi:MAG TPA: hypothetical protein VF503_03510 [Sphingobium sp.]|uniref:hypothetical protein n=1 Tax=Sphingobium sp. TaxID=1912891 RepID=UPI002ED5A5F8
MDLDFTPDLRAELSASEAKGRGWPDPARSAQLSEWTTRQHTLYTLPFKQMFPLVIRDVTRDWKLAEGRPVFLRITLGSGPNTLNTAQTHWTHVTSADRNPSKRMILSNQTPSLPYFHYALDDMRPTCSLFS